MDNIKLPAVLILIWDAKRAVEKNLSLQQGLQRFYSRSLADQFAKQFATWWNARQQHQSSDLQHFNAQHRAVINLIEMGLKGASIYEQLKSIELDIVEICEADIQEHAAKLPLLLQIPLIFLVFPAICMLLLVPTLYQLLH